uniref:Putative plant transposon protein domain-containing protein n=1 Tax=Solanum tuberosum TaxID=4113 RepID=M1DFK0_SOLTU
MLADQIVPGGLVRQPYVIAAKLIDILNEPNQAIERRDFSLAVLLTQLDELTKNIEDLEVQCNKKGRYVPPRERRNLKNNEDGQIKAMLTLLLQKANEQHSVLEELRENVLMLNQMTTSHSMLIHLLGSQLDQVLSSLYPEPKMGCPHETKANPTNGGLVREYGLKISTLGRFASWVKFAELLGSSPNALISHAFNLMINLLFGSVIFGEKPEVAKGTHRLTDRKTKGIILNEDATTPKGKAIKSHTNGGKGKGKEKAPDVSSDTDDIYTTHLTNFECEGEHQEPQIANSDDDELVAAQRVELRSKKMNDPSRIRDPQLTIPPPPVQKQAVVLAPHVQGPPPKSMNKLKIEGLKTILEEKRLSTDGVIDWYPEIMDCLKSHKFQIFTKPRGLYIPSWVREFYSAYSALIPQGKKPSTNFKLVDYVVVKGRKVKCDSVAINTVLGVSTRIDYDCQHMIRTKKLDNM